MDGISFHRRDFPIGIFLFEKLAENGTAFLIPQEVYEHLSLFSMDEEMWLGETYVSLFRP